MTIESKMNRPDRIAVTDFGSRTLQQFRRADFAVMLFGLVLLFAANEAFATLGQAPSVPGSGAVWSVPAVRALAATSGAQGSVYTLHTTQLENGTTVQEYANPAGLVFAVVWRGPVLPDVSALLGTYFHAFRAETGAARSMGKRSSAVTMVSDKLVVKSTGRMRSFVGYAYAPDLIPAGIDIKDVLP
jgi:hypothetical protein